MLHAERRRQNFSVGDVSRHLKLSIRQVEALERDDYKMFGGAVFVHGFLRNYAKLLGLDASLLIGAADRKLAAEGKPPPGEAHRGAEVLLEAPGARAEKSVMPLILAAAILAAAVAGWMMMRQDEPASGGVPATMVPSQYGADGTDYSDVAPLTEPGAEVVAEVVAEAGPDAVAVPQQEAVAPGPGTATSRERGRRISQGPPGVVQFGFREESWVEVTDGYGEIIFSELVPRGVARRITGSPPFSVIIGNASGVDLTYNDKPINLAQHTRVDVARLTLE
jgi:cytoskeleton protein RodZ